MLLLLLACLHEAPPSAVDTIPPIRAVNGPWVYGNYVTIAVGRQGEQSTLEAAWLQGENLLYSSSLDGGRGWSVPLVIDSAVESGDGGQVRPRLVVATAADQSTHPVLAYAVGGRARIALREGGQWMVHAVSSPAPGSGALLDVGVVGGEVVVAWLDTRRDPENWVSDVFAWYRGSEELVYSDLGDGVCVCCRPAVGAHQGRPAVAFRDQDGPNREVRLAIHDGNHWTDHGLVTHGGWAPGGCPSDGPVFDGEAVLVSDGRDGQRRLYRDDQLLSGAGAAAAVQPRAVGAARLWVEAADGLNRVVVAWGEHAASPVLEVSGRLEPLDPILVDGELWIPWQGDQAAILAVRPEGLRP